ncbi:hypothetical protein GCM10023172_40430 [Hymenobacter ginsengisoli]|uniref:Putative auto-transporter adhesin head GIN domain-containing protein n=1 Tax=Hymenobacter ginsengisoli TaxID=1051626 RepID=A0ABP8QQQ0_9BACT|nr:MULTISPECIES: head GIN domain-containing protein [unclassified Hymenobacter]MBO2032313.1 DUF2807 domain-containing protein [Hymenobacter sp. BT559]
MKNYLLPAVLWLLALAPALAQTETTTAPVANGPQVRPLEKFNAINVGTGIELTLTAGHTQRVEVSATTLDQREHILTTVRDGVLGIHYDNPDERDSNSKKARRDRHLRVAVTADQLHMLAASSGAAVTASGPFATPDFQLDISSGATVRADLNVGVLIVRQNGGSVIDLIGQAPRFDLKITSGSVFNGEKLLTNRAQIEASSGSVIKLAVKEVLMAEASGGSSIKYYGSPEVTKNVSGGGTISSR